MLKKTILSICFLVNFFLFASPPSTDTYVYYSVNGEGKIKVYKLDKTTGSLTSLNSVNVIGSPINISVSNNDKQLLTASFLGNKIASQAIESDGEVNAVFSSEISLPSGGTPHMIKTNPTNSIVYVPNYSRDLITQYNYNEVQEV